ncbi:alkylation response protein AidB-like acyl-CoA dehydrogenase [Bradyrhizobium sp. LM3.6]
MNFEDTPQEAAFRATARAWIAANAPQQYEDELRKSSLGRTQLKNANILEVAKAWQKKKADAGWACLHWPKDYGGRGSSPIERVIWQQEEGPFGKLSGMFIIGHGMCGPTMMAFAREEHKRTYLPPLASGAKKSGASCSPSRPAARMLRACARARRRTATIGSSTARKSGRRAHTTRITASS